MKKTLLLSLTLFISLHVLGQKPNFSLVGFGTGTVGGAGGTTVTVTTYDELAAQVAGTTKKIIKVSGTITGPNGGVILDVGSNKSIIGIGNTALISMVQLHLKNSQQVIIQNLKFSMIGSTLGSDADMICVETTSTNEAKYIWIDHCEFYNVKPTLPETAAKKDLYDGMIDIKKSSSLITISWCYFHDHWKCSLIGYTDTDTYDRKITYHHNYFKDIKSRAPSYRGGTGHVYNNYFDGLNDPNSPTSEGVHTREKACLLVENNYFNNYNKTIYNAIEDCTYEGFAYGSGNLFTNSPSQTANLCNSFTPPYNYTMHNAADVPSIVSAWSGVGKLDLVSALYSYNAASLQLKAYPSPVSTEATLSFHLPASEKVSVTIIDLTGRVVTAPLECNLSSGDNELKVDMENLSPGVYFYNLQIGDQLFTEKLIKE